MNDYWTVAICDECGEGYTSEEEYNNRHSPVVGDEHIEVHAECCRESEMSDYKKVLNKYMELCTREDTSDYQDQEEFLAWLEPQAESKKKETSNICGECGSVLPGLCSSCDTGL